MKIFFSKKGSSDILAPVVIFIILNLLFFALLGYFVFRQSSSASLYEEMYAKKIALLVDNSRCNTEIVFDILKLKEVAEKNNRDMLSVFDFDESNGEISVKLSSRGGYSYRSFSSCGLELELVENNLVLKIGEGKDE